MIYMTEIIEQMLCVSSSTFISFTTNKMSNITNIIIMYAVYLTIYGFHAAILLLITLMLANIITLVLRRFRGGMTSL
jgi:hypothetical protein